MSPLFRPGVYHTCALKPVSRIGQLLTPWTQLFGLLNEIPGSGLFTPYLPVLTQFNHRKGSNHSLICAGNCTYWNPWYWDPFRAIYSEKCVRVVQRTHCFRLSILISQLVPV